MRRILVVDDERQMTRTLCDILCLHGWETEARHSGDEAVAAVEREDFTAVLMDVKMEGVDGLAALRRIRQLRPAARVILMTGYSTAELLRQAEEDGALEILNKPVALPDLVVLLESVLSDGAPVLVVDDDAAFLASLGELVRARGFEALEAPTAESALSVLHERRPVVALMDLRLGNVEPGEIMLAIKRASPAVALILCGGHPNRTDPATSSMPLGAVYGSVRKPFSPDSLIGMLDDLVRR